MMGDPNERFVDVGVRESLYFPLRFARIRLLQLFIQRLDIVVEEDSRYHCQRQVDLYVFVGLVVAVHADVSQQIYVAE
jgi:hypothetical protein